MSEQQIPINRLLVPSSWPRFALNEERVSLFVELLAGGDDLPPIEVVADSEGRFLIADGVHRAHAARRAGREAISALVIEPVEGESAVVRAYLRALETATKTALPLTYAERRQAVVKLVATRPDLSHRAIAHLVGVSHDSVDRWTKPPADKECPDDQAGDEDDGDSTGFRLTAKEVAEQFVAGLAELSDARGLADWIVPSRMGRHLATALMDHHQGNALKEGRLYASWMSQAVALLEADS